MIEKLNTKKDLLEKLRAYNTNPDDETIRYKKKIEHALLSNPCLLYALNESTLYDQLFDPNDKEHWQYDKERNLYIPTDNCKINWELNEDTGEYEPLGEWDRYFSDTSRNANIRPYLFIPDAQTEARHYICYQVAFNEMPRYNNIEKYTNITFTIFVYGNDRIDKFTGIPRHDLIASIIRERFNWSNIFGMQTKLISSKESTTDNNYLVRTLVFQILDLNGIVYTPYGQETTIRNNEYWE
jgi:hypothetical protein